MDLVDEHPPLLTKKMPRWQMFPWYNKNIQTVKKHRRYCDRLWVRTSLCVHYEIFKVSKIEVKNTLASAKSEYYNKKIKTSKEIKGLFSMLWINYYITLPDKDTTHWFNNFFCQKLLSIHAGFSSSTLSQGMPLVEESCISMIDKFEPFKETDIRQLLEMSSEYFLCSWPYACTAWKRVSGCSDQFDYKDN